jgi:hypothetical protein
MKQFLLIISLIYFASCKLGYEADKEFYEKISGIKIPDNYKVLENIDNGEFVTATVFQMDTATINQFAKANHFDTTIISMPSWQFLVISKNYFNTYKPDFKRSDVVLVNYGDKGKNSWQYVIDTKTKRLWVEIQYPDLGGQ